MSGGWRPSELLDTAELHRRFVEALRDDVRQPRGEFDLSRKPLDLYGQKPPVGRLRVYMYNCTDHPSERDAGAYRIQLRVPGQKSRQRGNFEPAPGASLLVVGYVSEFDVFVMWDAYAHRDFPYFKGVQVAGSTVHRAAIRGLAEQRRHVRSASYQEQVVAARADLLVDGLRRRQELTHESLLRDGRLDLFTSSDEVVV